jgi:hypothetical protein
MKLMLKIAAITIDDYAKKKGSPISPWSGGCAAEKKLAEKMTIYADGNATPSWNPMGSIEPLHYPPCIKEFLEAVSKPLLKTKFLFRHRADTL